MNHKISRILRKVALRKAPRGQFRNAYRNLKRRWNRTPRAQRHAILENDLLPKVGETI